MKQIELQRKYLKIMRESAPTMEAIFNAMFSHDEFPLFEYSQNNQTVKISYKEARSNIIKVAYNINKTLPDLNGAYIALNMDNSPEWVYGFWGILMSGNKPYLVNLRHPVSLTKSILNHLNIEYSINGPKAVDLDIKTREISVLLKDFSGDYQHTFANEIALSSSGTSLDEKICIFTGKEILKQLLNIESILQKTSAVKKMYDGTIKLLAFLPFYHIFGLNTVYFWFTYFGYTIVLLNDYSPKTIMETIRQHKVTHVFAVPLFWHKVTDEVIRAVKMRGDKTFKAFIKGINKINSIGNICPTLALKIAKKKLKEIRDNLFGDSVQFCVTGGSYIRNDALKIINGLGYPLHNGYGSTEIGITSFEMSNKPKDLLTNSIGESLASAEYLVRDDCLFVRGESTCSRLIVNGEEVEIPEYFNTLDLVKVIKGKYYIIGRKSDLIIGDDGENINPDELEKIFYIDDEDVLAYSVLSLKECDKENIAIICQVYPTLSIEKIRFLETIIEGVNNTLPMTSRVKQIYFTFDPIKNENAIKVSRKYIIRDVNEGNIELLTLKDIAEKEYENYEPDELDRQVMGIFSKALNIEVSKVHLSSHFLYDLHGTSLDYYTLLAYINNDLDIELTYNEEHPLATPKDFADEIRKRQNNESN